jgi:hypothetical protein
MLLEMVPAFSGVHGFEKLAKVWTTEESEFESR